MKVMNVWDLRELGFSHYQVRSMVDAVNQGEPAYAWMQEVLIQEGMKKPKLIPELFIDAYRKFRLRQVDEEMATLREKWRAFDQRNAA